MREELGSFYGTLLAKVGLSVILFLTIFLIFQKVPGFINPFGYFYLSFSLVPYLLIVPLDIFCYAREFQREAYLEVVLIRELVSSVISGISEEIDRWGVYFVVLYAGHLIFDTVNILPVAFWVTSLVFFLNYGLDRPMIDNLTLALAAVLYTYIFLQYGLLTSMVLHTIFDVVMSLICSFRSTAP